MTDFYKVFSELKLGVQSFWWSVSYTYSAEGSDEWKEGGCNTMFINM